MATAELFAIKEGELTRTVYTLVSDKRYDEAVQVLNNYGQSNRTSRALLSLQAYCYYYLGEFTYAADLFERLTLLHPYVTRYWFCLADCYCKCQLPGEAKKLIERLDIDQELHSDQVNNLRAAVAYYENRLPDAVAALEQSKMPDTIAHYNKGVILCRLERYKDAVHGFSDADTSMEAETPEHFQANVKYALAYAGFRSRDLKLAKASAEEVVKQAMEKHEEFKIGARTDGVQTQTLANTWLLEKSRVIEACNLLFAVEFQRRNFNSARKYLTDIPPREEEDVDAYTIHNECLLGTDDRPEHTIDTLGALFTIGEPKQVLFNLLVCLFREGRDNAVADVLAENSAIMAEYLDDWFYRYCQALLLVKTDYAEAYNKFEQLLQTDENEMRKLRQERVKVRTLFATASGTGEQSNERTLQEESLQNREEQILQRYIPTIMSQAKMYWQHKNYDEVRRVLMKGQEYAGRSVEFKGNAGHAFFMLGTKEALTKPETLSDPSSNLYQAISMYSDVLRSKYNKKEFLKLSPSVIANIAICYVLCHNSEDASEVLTRIDKLEESHAHDETSDFFDMASKCEYSTFVSVALGILYCTRGLFEYGLHRITESMQRATAQWAKAEKADALMRETWQWTKVVIFYWVEKLLLMLLVTEPKSITDMLNFLQSCEKQLPHLQTTTEELKATRARRTIAYEARLIKHLLLQVRFPMSPS